MGYANKRVVFAECEAKRNYGEGSPQHQEAVKGILESQESCPHPERDHSTVPDPEGGKLLYCLRCSLVLKRGIK